jgi:hypothetical protein
MIFKKLAVAAAFTMSLGLVEAAQADYVESLNETFASGATFSGNVTFDSGFNAIAVNGVLTGYSNTQIGPVLAGGVIDTTVSDSINWVDYPGNSYPGIFAPLSQNRLDDGDPNVPLAVSNSILFTIDFTDPANPIFVFVSPLNTVNDELSYNGINTYTGVADALVSGSVAPVPVPAAVWLFAGGMSILAGFRRRNS